MPTIAEDDVSNDCDTLGVRWGNRPCRGGVTDVIYVAASSLATPTFQVPFPISTAKAHCYLGHTGSCSNRFLCVPTVVHGDTSNCCDTLCMR